MASVAVPPRSLNSSALVTPIASRSGSARAAAAAGSTHLVSATPVANRSTYSSSVAIDARHSANRPPCARSRALGKAGTLTTSTPPAARPGCPGAALSDDPVYGASLRVLLGPSRPLLLIPSNRRDVAREHELLLPLFADRERRSEVDLRPLGLPIEPYSFARELPEGVQDTDHTLAVKDLVFLPELAAALGPGDGSAPVMWPEHCVDPLLLAEHDLVVVGGPDTNFWHGALFEPVAREFADPPSSVPLALDMREPGEPPSYGSRRLIAQLSGSGAVFPHSRAERVELDERLYPTHAMILACRNPYAAALGRSRWVVFVAGTRSLGTSGAVLALTLMLRRMRADPEADFASEVPIGSSRVRARVAAALVRVAEVEQAALRRDGELHPRQRRRLTPEGLDPYYSDSYVPTEVDLLGYDGGDHPQWTTLGRLGGPMATPGRAGPRGAGDR